MPTCSSDSVLSSAWPAGPGSSPVWVDDKSEVRIHILSSSCFVGQEMKQRGSCATQLIWDGVCSWLEAQLLL